MASEFKKCVRTECSEQAETIGGCWRQGAERVPRSLDRTRSVAELGAGRRAGAGRADRRGRRAGGSQCGRGLEAGVGAEAATWPWLPWAVPVFLRRWPLGTSICQRSLLLSPPPSVGRPGSASGGRGTRHGEPFSCQASGGATHGGVRHTKNAVSGGSERGRQFRDSNSRPHPLVPPPPPGLGPRPWRQCGRAESVGPYLTVPRFAQPPPGRPGPWPGKGRPLVLAAGAEVGPPARSPTTCQPGKVCAPSAGRCGPPLASAVTVGDFLDSSSARAAARTAGTAGEGRSPSEGSGARGCGEKINYPLLVLKTLLKTVYAAEPLKALRAGAENRKPSLRVK
ncbi:translation initiation factor IF-2-like [Artibeus jamaicensis]|uniref:translation initiation factor IF-2-like n=1 Tax=Artibeus jamaicensis TaxID=9417 RepID=UPI00235AC60E|nr:translation initiation factor IF-2-like [Artibeus jamaicensis]